MVNFTYNHNVVLRIDKQLQKMAISCVAILVLSQILLSFDSTRHFVCLMDQLEGKSPVSPTQASSMSWRKANGRIKVTMLNMGDNSSVFLTINGQVVGNFANGYLEVPIAEDDNVAVDARLKNEQVKLIVNFAGRNIVNSPDGKIYIIKKEVVLLDKVNIVVN